MDGILVGNSAYRYAVTAFLPIAINALVTMCDMSAVISNYASETILLLLGASILTVSWKKQDLIRELQHLSGINW